MHLLQVLGRCRPPAHFNWSIAEIHAIEVITPKHIAEAFPAMSLLCGMHTDVLMGLSPRAQAISRVWAAM